MGYPLRKHYVIDLLGLLSIGLFSLGYVVIGRSFAEMHIQLPFLDFPVFIGEMLIAFCLLLFFLKRRMRFGKRDLWIVAYFTFVLAKAFYGYSKFGPLAFRHAALFYYPIFIVFGASFYRKEFFIRSKGLVLAAVILAILITETFKSYWLIACFCLALILILKYPGKPVRYILLTVLLLGVPFGLFFDNSRTMMVANFATGFFIVLAVYVILKMKRTLKVGLVVAGGLVMIVVPFWFSDQNALLSLVKYNGIIETFRDRDAECQAILRGEKKGVEILGLNALVDPRSVRIYNPDKPLFSDRTKDLPGSKIGSGGDQLVMGYREPEFEEEIIAEINNGGGRALQGESRGTVRPLSSSGSTQEGPVLDRPEENADHEFREEQAGGAEAIYREEADMQEVSETPKDSTPRDLTAAYGNAVFRLFIWRDMLVEMKEWKPLFGFDFGKPLRSITLETLYWGVGDWGREGWIAAHNSFLHIFYRAGVVGLLIIGAMLTALGRMIARSVQARSVVGIMLCGIIMNLFVAANFLVILELPYTAIPIWALYGLTYAYLDKLRMPDPKMEGASHG